MACAVTLNAVGEHAMRQDGRPFPEFGFLYATPLDSNLIKSLLLFFDGVAVVASPQRIASAVAAEPWFFLPFLQSDMSKVWIPEDFFDAEFRTAYRTEVQSLLSSGWFDNRPRNLVLDRYLFPNQMAGLPPDWNVRAQDEVARFRDRLIGPGSNDATAGIVPGNLLDELAQRGLLEVRQYTPMSGFQRGDPGLVGTPPAMPFAEQPASDAPAVPGMHNLAGVPGMPNWPGLLPGMLGSNVGNPPVLALDATFSQVNDALVSQFARSRAGHRSELVLAPVNASEASLQQLLDAWRGSQQQVTVGRVILQDLEVVGQAIENVSLEEIVRFREKHGEAHREYMRELRSLVRDMSQLSAEAQENELFDRRQKLSKLALELSRISKSTWKSGARFLLGITGAAISIAAGNVVGGAVSGAGALLGLGGSKDKGDAFTYLCHIARI
jgi:hypothetical protein